MSVYEDHDSLRPRVKAPTMVRIEVAMKAKLQEAAFVRHRSLSSLISKILQDWLDSRSQQGGTRRTKMSATTADQDEILNIVSAAEYHSVMGSTGLIPCMDG